MPKQVNLGIIPRVEYGPDEYQRYHDDLTKQRRAVKRVERWARSVRTVAERSNHDPVIGEAAHRLEVLIGSVLDALWLLSEPEILEAIGKAYCNDAIRRRQPEHLAAVKKQFSSQGHLDAFERYIGTDSDPGRYENLDGNALIGMGRDFLDKAFDYFAWGEETAIKLEIAPHEKDAARGKKIIEGAKAGHAEKYGTREEIERRYAQYRSEYANTDPGLKRKRRARVVAKKMNVSYKTILRAVNSPAPHSDK